MTILCEATLRRYIDEGYIVVNANDGCIRGQSYSCHAAKVLPGGPGGPEESRPTILDWSYHGGTEVYRIQPRQLVWVRIREIVRLPLDVCAFWWQTNTLSRKGLMLVNMSMVDPGYEGSLACLFVNFGREPVDIDPEMTVARLVFHRLDGANEPYPRREARDEYDRGLREVALNGPSSFLSFQEFSTAFDEERKKAFENFRAEADKFSHEIQTKLDKTLQESFDDKTKDFQQTFIKASGVVAVVVVILGLVQAFAPWVKDRLVPDVQEQIEAAVDSEIGKRLQPVSAIQSSQTQALEQRLRELEEEIRALERPPEGGQSP